MAEWIPIENSISLENLLKRWKGIKIDGEKFGFQTINQFVSGGQLTAYDRKDWIIVNGHKEWRGQKREPFLGLDQFDPFELGTEIDIIFDMEEIYRLEKQMFPSSNARPQDEKHYPPDYKTEYMPAEELRKELGLGPARLVDYLREHHREIPLFGLLQNDRDYFYNYQSDLVNVAEMLGKITIHRQDWEDLKQKEKEIPPDMLASAMGVKTNERALAEAQKQNEIQQQANKKLHETNKELHARIAELEAKFAEVNIHF